MTGATLSGQDLIDRLTEITLANLTNYNFGVSVLAGKAGMSRSYLHRKVKKEAKCSASRFICQVRLKKALQLLQESSATISETAFNCGFHSVTYFDKCFHDFYGFTPGEARTEKYKKTLVKPA